MLHSRLHSKVRLVVRHDQPPGVRGLSLNGRIELLSVGVVSYLLVLEVPGEGAVLVQLTCTDPVNDFLYRDFCIYSASLKTALKAMFKRYSHSMAIIRVNKEDMMIQ